MCKNNKLLILITIYIVISISLIIKYNTFYTNVLNPLLSLCIIIYFRNIRFCKNRKYYIYIVVISCIHVIIYFYLGFIFGFSKSPYNHGIIDILKNIIIQILPIISVEMIRAFILNTNKNNKLIHILITILLILVEIKYNILIDLFQNKEEFFKYICSTILPLIASGILCTYLALKGSYSLSLVIRITNKLIVLILPILPNLDWFVTGTFNILSPVLIFLLFKYKFTQTEKDVRTKKRNIYEKINYAITIAFSIALVCFMLGIFKYKPISVLSSSMHPIFNRGDIVIFKKIDEINLKEIHKNSIIIYSIGNQNIAHRVINIIEKNGNTLYQTKGDSNNIPDKNLVKVNQIQGIYVFNIKYLGFPSIWLYDYFHN